MMEHLDSPKVAAWIYSVLGLGVICMTAVNCGLMSKYGPPVLEHAIEHFREVLETEHVPVDGLKCEVEINRGTALMLCEAKLPGGPTK